MSVIAPPKARSVEGCPIPSATGATYWYVLYQKASDYSVLARACPICRRCCVIVGVIGESAYKNGPAIRGHLSKAVQGMTIGRRRGARGEQLDLSLRGRSGAVRRCEARCG